MSERTGKGTPRLHIVNNIFSCPVAFCNLSTLIAYSPSLQSSPHAAEQRQQEGSPGGELAVSGGDLRREGDQAGAELGVVRYLREVSGSEEVIVCAWVIFHRRC